MLLRKLIFQNIIWRGLYFFSLFLLNIIISRYFKADGSGEIYYIVNNLSFILLIVSLCLESGAAYFISKNEIDEQKTALFCLLWSVAGTLISLIFLHWIKNGSSNIVLSGNEYLVGCGCYVLGVLLTTYFTPLFFAKKNFLLPNFILFSLTLLMIALLIAFGPKPFIHRHFTLIYFCSFLLQGTVLAFIYFFQSGAWKNIGFLSCYDLSKLLRYSLLNFSGNIISFLVYRVDYWFVSKNCSVADLGNYIQVAKLGQIFMLMPATIASAVFINTASKSEQKTEPLQIISRWVVLVYILIISVGVLFGRWLFPFIYGPTFNLMYAPFLLLAPGIISLSTLALLTAYYAGIGKVIVNIKGAVYALLLVVPGYFFLTPVYGIKAAAAVSSIGYMFYLVYVMWCFKNDHRETKWHHFFIAEINDIKLLKKIFFSNDKHHSN